MELDHKNTQVSICRHFLRGLKFMSTSLEEKPQLQVPANNEY